MAKNKKKNTPVSFIRLPKDIAKQDWLRLRQKGIGSSDIGAVCGLNDYKSPLDIYNEKLADPPIEIPDNEAMEWGRELEDDIATIYTRRTGKKTYRDRKIRIHPEKPFLMASVDRYAVEWVDGKRQFSILEIKTVAGYAKAKWDNTIPLSYYCQLQHQMYVTGIHRGEFALGIDGHELEIIPVEYDPDFAEKQEEAAERFWNENVLKHNPPPDTVVDLEKIQADKLNKEAKIASQEIVDLHREALDLRAAKNKIEGDIESIQEKIKEFMGRDTLLVTDENVPLATWNAIEPMFDSERFQTEHPDLYKSYKTKKVSRRFTLKGRAKK